MTGSGPRLPGRRLVTAAVTAASALVFAVGVVHAADPRLTDADALLEKSGLVLTAALQEQDPLPTKKAQAQYDRALQRAIADIAEARAQIATAQSIADGSQP